MKAAVVHAFGEAPRYDDFNEPSVTVGESLVRVSAAATSRIVRARAEGTHYSSDLLPPFVVGVDGIGETRDRGRVYFLFPRAPFGSMAERAPVPDPHTVPVPDGLDDALAAAAAVPGWSCWVPLTRLAPIRPGESVLVNGATGSSGTMAVQVAKYLGARRVIATGRDVAKLKRLAELGADVVIPLAASTEPVRDAVRREARESSIGVVLDYLWGPSAEAILAGLGGPGAPRGSTRIRFVQVGTMSGRTISLEGALLRSSGVEILGSGVGAFSSAELTAAVGEFLQAMARRPFVIDFDVFPLAEVERSWPLERDRRQVYRVG